MAIPGMMGFLASVRRLRGLREVRVIPSRDVKYSDPDKERVWKRNVGEFVEWLKGELEGKVVGGRKRKRGMDDGGRVRGLLARWGDKIYEGKEF